ncbi:MAG: MoaD/ThiS family protein [Luteolibacter sp.]
MNPFTVSYFGLLAERRGIPEEHVTSSASTAAELYSELDVSHQLGLSIENFRVAVNDEFVPWNQPLNPGDRIALLPPMSGG